MTILTPLDWKDYELIDSGDKAKLERFGAYIIARPDPRAIWQKKAPAQTWESAHATFVHGTNDDGHWDIKRAPPNDWSVKYHDLVFTLKPTSFKHVGVFPEQAVNWLWLQDRIVGHKAKVLNLFAYTGGATMAACLAGAEVTHVDSAKGAVEWAKQNAATSGLSQMPIRWIIDDANKFVQREARRGSTYDGFILDPPRFGRGPKGEIWKIEENLPPLLSAIKPLISTSPLFVLINAYTADLSGIVISHLLNDITHALHGTCIGGELVLTDTTSGRVLPNGIFARWSAS